MTVIERSGDVARAAILGVSSLLVGALTFAAQGWPPDAVLSFANSASGWTMVTVLLLPGVRAGPAVASVLGGTSFVLLTVGTPPQLTCRTCPTTPPCSRWWAWWSVPSSASRAAG